MLEFPDDNWINEQIKKQNQNRVVFNGLNLFAIWLKDNNVPDEPCPPDIDPVFGEVFMHIYMRGTE